MRLESARLVNVCQHADLFVEFGAGITAIVGSNGAGKSNLIGMIRSSITNDYSSLGGSKDLNVRRGKAAEEPSYVETTWTVPAGTLVIRRGLSGVKSSLVLNAEQIVPKKGKAAKEKEVTEKALELLRTSPGAINNFLFANYDRLREIVDGTKAQRAALFTSLCGVEVVDRVDRYLRDLINQDKVRLEEFDSEESDSLRAEWGASKAEYQDSKRKLRTLRSSLPSDEEQSEIRESVLFLTKLQQTQSDARDRRNKAKDSLRKAKERLPYLEEQVDYWSSRSSTIKECVSKLTEQSYETAANVREYSVQKRAFEKVQEAKAGIAQLGPPPVLAVPTAVVGDSDEDSLTECLANRQVQINRIERHLKLIEEGKYVCPTCDQAIDSSESVLEDQKAELRQLVKEAETCKKQLQAIRKLKKLKVDHENKLSNWKQKSQLLETQLTDNEELAALYDQDRDLLAEAEAVTARLKKFKKWEIRTSGSHAASKTSLTVNKERIESFKSEIADCDKTLGEFKRVTARELTSAQNKFDSLSAKLQQVAASKASLGSQYKARISIVKRLRTLNQKRRQLGQVKNWVDVAVRARAVCHRDRLPARVVAGMLATTTRQVNQYLKSLAVPFGVTVDAEEFAYTAVHQDGSEEPAKRLSTGQSLCLGIAFWLARASVFAGQLPFFCLDEPTANLDEERLLNVAEVIGKLSVELESSGRQGVVVTHDVSVARSATQIITL